MVVDASVLFEYLVREHADAVRRRITAAWSTLWAPHLVDAEVGQVLRQRLGRGEIRPATANAALTALADLPLHRTPHVGLLERAWSLRETVSFYDGLYVALAERLRMPLLTLDARLAKASGVRAEIELIA